MNKILFIKYSMPSKSNDFYRHNFPFFFTCEGLKTYTLASNTS